MHLYNNILGTFVLNQNFQVREKELGKDSTKKYLDKFKNIKMIDEKDIGSLRRALEAMKEYREDLIRENMEIVRDDIRDSVHEDLFISQAINTIDDLNKVINMLTKRLREWYSYYFPEGSQVIEDNELFLKYVSMEKKEIMKEFKIKKSMGPTLDKSFLEPMESLAKEIKSLYRQREEKEKYLNTLMEKNCPNIKAIAGSIIGAKLISIAGSLRKLMLFPASTVQLLGAEEALFKHIKNKAKCPKYGVLFAHQLVQKAPKEKKGKAARIIADKISLAAKVDFFKGEFIGDKLLKEIEEKLS